MRFSASRDVSLSIDDGETEPSRRNILRRHAARFSSSMNGMRTLAKVAVAGVRVIASLSRNCIEALRMVRVSVRRDSGVTSNPGGGGGGVRRDMLALNRQIERVKQIGRLLFLYHGY